MIPHALVIAIPVVWWLGSYVFVAANKFFGWFYFDSEEDTIMYLVWPVLVLFGSVVGGVCLLMSIAKSGGNVLFSGHRYIIEKTPTRGELAAKEQEKKKQKEELKRILSGPPTDSLAAEIDNMKRSGW